VGISISINRVTEYFKRHGLAETVKRASQATRRALFANHMVVYCCDLATMPLKQVNIPESMSIERVRSEGELGAKNREAITGFWNPDLAQRNIQERFQKGAILWLIRSGEILAGYGWTLQGRTVEPHYFPLAADDVQFLDFHVFPKYRGRAMDWFLMTHILHRLAAEGRARAFGEAAEWNKASLSSFAMTPFRRLGWARKFTVLGHTIVSWSGGEPVPQAQRDGVKLPGPVTSRRPSQEKA